MITFVVIVLSVAYLFLLALVLNLNWRLYKEGEARAQAEHQANRARMLVSDLVEDERRREQTQERHVREWLA